MKRGGRERDRQRERERCRERICALFGKVELDGRDEARLCK